MEKESEKGLVLYKVAGEEVKLSFQIVKSFLTKGNGQVTDQDLVQFIALCKYNKLNPFLNEAYLVKYGSYPAQIIVSKEALMKRAESCLEYKGIQAGIIVSRGEEILELEGAFFLPQDRLLGGWAKVYRSDRDFPAIAKVRLAEYNTNKSTWLEKTPTMISKVAKVQALREAFPSQLGGMYTQEEQTAIEINHVEEPEIEIQAEPIDENEEKITI